MPFAIQTLFFPEQTSTHSQGLQVLDSKSSLKYSSVAPRLNHFTPVQIEENAYRETENMLIVYQDGLKRSFDGGFH